MTVSYSSELCNVRVFGFARLLFRWKGSIYRLIYWECCLFLAAYYVIAIVYRFALKDPQQRAFERLAKYCEEFTDLVPVTFVLGFFIGPLVLARWWSIFTEIPWPDKAACKLVWYVKGKTERSRTIRRTFVRYLILMLVLTLQRISVAVKRRFPTRTHIIDSGLMTADESRAIDDLNYKHPNWWIPAMWYQLLIREANSEGLITDGDARSMLDDLNEYRQHCNTLWCYDWVSIPLAYTQVVTIAVYSFFVACLFGRQYVYKVVGQAGDSSDTAVLNQYFPFFTCIQFIFYMGWLKVGEELANPLGEDDEDFEVNWLIDRHLQTAFLVVDGITTHPDMVKDLWWHDETPPDLPYTEASQQLKVEPFMGSAHDMPIKEKTSNWQIDTIAEEPTNTGTVNEAYVDVEAGTSAQSGVLAQTRQPSTPSMPRTLGLITQVSRTSQASLASSNTSRKPSAISNFFGGKKKSEPSPSISAVDKQVNKDNVPQQQSGLNTALLNLITEQDFTTANPVAPPPGSPSSDHGFEMTAPPSENRNHH